VAYSTASDVQNACGGLKRYKQAFDWDNDGNVDASAVDDCIVEADALIDSFASKRFSVPFNPVPPIIKSFSARLALLVATRRRGPLNADQQTEWDSIAGTEQGKEGWLYRLATGRRHARRRSAAHRALDDGERRGHRHAERPRHLAGQARRVLVIPCRPRTQASTSTR
jgi:hypothetical protein